MRTTTRLRGWHSSSEEESGQHQLKPVILKAHEDTFEISTSQFSLGYKVWSLWRFVMKQSLALSTQFHSGFRNPHNE